jgi:hypothetical protein
MTADFAVLLSAIIVGLLGTGHLVLTYVGPKLLPRDRALQPAMDAVAPVITAQTTIWRCWIGFNASHSLGAILFGLVFGYLALEPSRLFYSSGYLQAVGAVVLLSYVVLARRYWFLTPLAGLSLALLLYVGGLVAGRIP